jgi:hypothetical protein
MVTNSTNLLKRGKMEGGVREKSGEERWANLADQVVLVRGDVFSMSRLDSH